jgi:hypothetical protein
MNSSKLLREQQIVSAHWGAQGRAALGRFASACARGLLGLGVAGLFLAATPALAQNTGSIFGNVVDRTGAAVPNATITAVDTEHGVTRAVKSNSIGEFQVQNLPVGTYILTVASPNFETSVVTDIKIDANANVKEPIALQPGAATDSVTVEDTSGSTIDAKSATLGTLIDNKLIQDLPIDGQNVVALSALLPGVVDVNAPATFTGDTGGPTYSASGSRNTQNLLLFDGLVWNNQFYNTGVNYPTPHELQEISVILNNYKAEYGRNSGSVFNVISKQGTSQFHGAIWDFIQNQMFNASDYLTHINPKDNQNQFGFQVGGPILKDKLFFSGSYQQLIGHLQTTATALTPGYAERGVLPDGVTPRPCTMAGPFPGQNCASLASDVALGKLTNPLDISGTGSSGATPLIATEQLQSNFSQAGGVGSAPCLALLQTASNYAASNVNAAAGKIEATYLPNAEIPSACLDPVMLAVLNKYAPEPQPGQTYLTTTSPAPTGDQNYFARIDYHVNGQHSIDVRYNHDHATANVPLGVNSQSQGVATYDLSNQVAHLNFGNVGETWVITPNLLNTIRAGYKRFEASQLPDDNNTLNNFGGNFVEPGIPTLPEFNFGSSYFTLGSTSQGFQDHINEDFELYESLSWSHGKHSVKGGFDFLRLQYLTRADYPGELSFSSTFTDNALGDGLTGEPTQLFAQNRLNQGGIQHNVAMFLQDDWRILSRLTLNLGVRYEIPFQWFQPQGQAATFIPGHQSTVFPAAPGGLAFPGDKGVLPSLVPTDFNGIAPRFGFIYDVTGAGKFLIRGGGGVFFDAVNANVIGVGEPYHYSFNVLTPPGGASNPLAGLGASPNGQPNGQTLVIPAGFDPKNPQFIGPYSLFFPDPGFRTPYVLAFNFGFQYHVPHGGVLDTNYVGKFARKLTVPLDLNPSIFDCTGGYFQANPTNYCTGANSTAASEKSRSRFNDFNYGGQGLVDILSVGTSSYNALQLQYTQRSGKLLTLLGSYTYSKSIDLQTNGQTTSNTAPDVFNIKSERGLSDNNAKHNLTLGWTQRFPKVTQFDGITNKVLTDWVFSGQYYAHTGRPFSVTINNDTALVGEPGQRAALVPGMNPILPSNRHRAAKVAEYFNREAFTYPTIGTFSNVGRNSFIGPGYILTNFALGRDFPLENVRDGMRFNFRAEAFNVFNTPNLANPNSNFSCSTTSISSSAVPGTAGFGLPGVPCDSTVSITGAPVSSPGTFGGLIPGTQTSQFAQVRSTYGNNGNTSTNGRKMQFSLTLYY